MLTKCTANMLYGRYKEMRLKANKTSDNVFKHFSDERIWLKNIIDILQSEHHSTSQSN